jgi:hypothetical protein
MMKYVGHRNGFQRPAYKRQSPRICQNVCVGARENFRPNRFGDGASEEARSRSQFNYGTRTSGYAVTDQAIPIFIDPLQEAILLDNPQA